MQKIYNYALWLLSKRSYSKSGLTNKIKLKLRKLTIPIEEQSKIIHSTISKLEEKQLLDDQKHKEIIINRYQQRWGFQKIKQKLAAEQIELTKEEWNLTQIDLYAETESPLEKKTKKYWDKFSQKFPGESFKIKTKTIQGLLAQGHDYQEIKSSLKNLINTDTEPN